MSNPFDFLTAPLAYPFMVRGLIAAVLVGVVCATVGTYIVLRGMAFFGDALAHAILPGVAIGYLAGQTSQPVNSIVINASGSTLNGATASAFYVDPIRLATGEAGALVYNTTTSEITFDTGKTFVIDHPIDVNKYLVHACIEGPECGVYYRGESKIEEGQQSVRVNLPPYFKYIACEPTIQITPKYNGKLRTSVLSYDDINMEDDIPYFMVYGEEGFFSWAVLAKRKHLEVEPTKSSVIIKGNGPYMYPLSIN